MATKFEAFKTRGKMDFYSSHDFEDIVTVLDGRIEIVGEINMTNEKLRKYLVSMLEEINEDVSFKGAFPGHFVPYGSVAGDRVEMFEEKINLIKL